MTGLAALAELAAQTAQIALPRDRPLWQMQVLEDLGDGRVGVVAKVHHSVMDGAAAVGVLGALFDLEPTSPSDDPVARGEPHRDAGPRHRAGRAHDRAPSGRRGAHRGAHLPGAAIGFVRALRDAGPVGHLAAVGTAHVVEPFDLRRRAA